MGKWTSQQVTEQKARAVRFRLHVETLQTQYSAPKSIGFLHALQRRH
jgi:hypothetical protein